MPIPLVVKRSNRFAAGLIMAVAASLMYSAATRIHLTQPSTLPLSDADLLLPFIPWTVWIYLSDYILFAATFLVTREMTSLNRWIYAFMFIQTVSVTVFLAWPTWYPRHLFPVPADTDRATLFLIGFLRDADTPSGCLPSLHVSCVALSVLHLRHADRGLFAPGLLWGVLIAISTITTRQHYLADIIGGLLLAGIGYVLFYRLATYKE